MAACGRQPRFPKLAESGFWKNQALAAKGSLRAQLRTHATVLSVASADTIDAAKAAESLARLTQLYAEIEDVKAENSRRLTEAAIAMLRRLRARDAKRSRA